VKWNKMGTCEEVMRVRGVNGTRKCVKNNQTALCTESEMIF